MNNTGTPPQVIPIVVNNMGTFLQVIPSSVNNMGTFPRVILKIIVNNKGTFFFLQLFQSCEVFKSISHISLTCE